jgi:hypothetical protein
MFEQHAIEQLTHHRALPGIELRQRKPDGSVLCISSCQQYA